MASRVSRSVMLINILQHNEEAPPTKKYQSQMSVVTRLRNPVPKAQEVLGTILPLIEGTEMLG